MNAYSWFITVMLILGGVLLVVLYSQDMLAGKSITGVVLLAAAFIILYLWLKWEYQKVLDSKKNEESNKFNTAWEAINSQLRNMPGGDRVQWEGGKSITAQQKVYYRKNGEKKTFFGFLAFLANTRQRVVIQWDADDKNIVGYYSDPSPDLINNLFHGFKFFESEQDQKFRYPYMPRSKYGRRPIFPTAGPSVEYEPTDDWVEDAIAQRDPDEP